MEAESNQNTQLGELLESLAAIEAQRDLLGDIINPAVEEIRNRVRSHVVTPTEEQLQQAESWQTLVKTTTELNIPTPEMPADVAVATEVIARYQQVAEVIGDTAVNSQTTSDRKTEIQVEEQDPTTTLEVTDPTDRDSLQNDNTDNKPESAKGRVIIRSDDKDFIPVESVKDMYVVVLQALSEAEDNTIETTKFLRDLTGISPVELNLMKTGKIQLDPSIDTKSAAKAIRQFYSIVKRLRDTNLIEHTKGTRSATATTRHGTPGQVRLFAPPKFTRTGDDLRIELVPRPYQLRIDLHEQSLENGRGRTEISTMEATRFTKVAEALGVIALKPHSETARFTNVEAEQWYLGLTEEDISDFDATSRAQFSKDLRTIMNAFEGDFPLRLSTRYSYAWAPGSTVEVSEGRPEKPNFDQAIVISIGDLGYTATIDGKTHDLTNYSAESIYANIIQGDVTELLGRARKYFSVLSTLDKDDEMSLEDLVELANQTTDTDQIYKQHRDWLRILVKKLNSLTEETLINWRNRNGIVIDINRSIIIEGLDDTTSESPEPSSDDTLGEVPPEDTKTVTKTTKSGEEPSPTESAVAERKSAEAVVEAMIALDQRTKQIIRGRLITDGRFEYPHKLEEAAYLMSLIANPEVKAEIRECSSRFRSHKDSADFQNFLAEALYACYIRTRSWGDFTELATAISAKTPAIIGNDVKRMAEDFDRATTAAVRTSEEREAEQSRNQRYLEDALVSLVEDGYAQPPRNPIQAIGLLDLLRTERTKIAENKTQAQFDRLIKVLHDDIYEILGKGNALSLIESRTPRRASKEARAVQTASGEQGVLHRTDTHRFGDGVARSRRRRRK